MFSSEGGARPVFGFSKAKARLDRRLAARLGRAPLAWMVHDLHQSMTTHMNRNGVEPHVIEVRLRHVLKSVAGTYRQCGYLPENAKALQRWADELLTASGDAHRAAGEEGMALLLSTEAA